MDNLLLKACTSERKRDISSSYGEGLGLLLLRNYKDVHPFGVLKIHNGKASTPDFIVINKHREVSLLSGIKSTINEKTADPKGQLLNYNSTHNCLGVQVAFNKGD